MIPRQIFSAYDQRLADTPREYRFCPLCGAPLSRDAHDPAARMWCGNCGWVHYRNPPPGVVILITEEDRVLIGRRAGSSFAPNLWCLPGGFVEFHEDFLTAAIRETREETGLDVEISSIISVVSNFLAPDLHTLVVVLAARVIGGTPFPGDDLAELRWTPLAGPFPDMAFEADRHIIERYRLTILEGAPVDPDYTRP